MTKLRLHGSSVIEAVIASVIFLIIFVLALQAVVGMSIKEVRPCSFISVDREYKTVLKGCIEGSYTIGKHQLDFEWGNMEVLLEKYEKAEDILKVSIAIYIKSGTTKIIHRHIIKQLRINEI